MRNLSPDARRECLFLARKTIHERIRGQKESRPYQPVQPELSEPRGAFVTLKSRGSLRGCIGCIIAVKPLWQTIEECAVSSALSDYRFPPVEAAELPDISLEISVLSPIQRIQSVDEIQVGVHGIIISQGVRRGLLLPQVATEYGWDRDTFLRHTCRKAGLPEDAWRKGAEIDIFSAEVFGEETEGL